MDRATNERDVANIKGPHPHHFSAAFIFATSTAASFVALTFAGYVLLRVLLRDPEVLMYAELIYLPVVALFLVISIGIGLYASHHCFKWLIGKGSKCQ